MKRKASIGVAKEGDTVAPKMSKSLSDPDEEQDKMSDKETAIANALYVLQTSMSAGIGKTLPALSMVESNSEGSKSEKSIVSTTAWPSAVGASPHKNTNASGGEVAEGGSDSKFSQPDVLMVDPSLSPEGVDSMKLDFEAMTVKIKGDDSFVCKVLASSHGENTDICMETGNEAKDPTYLHQFIGTAHLAFAKHIGFTFVPQQIFILICQAIATHVSLHKEELRKQFVAHEGKKKLLLECYDWDLSREEWLEAVASFDKEIAANTVKDTYVLFDTIRQFSTATPIEITAGQVTLMDVCKSYFKYVMRTRCGIPSFSLEGTVEDWKLLRRKAEELIATKTLPLLSQNWLPALLPVLDKFVEAKRSGIADRPFFESFFKRGHTSGSGSYTYISGWINVFFPYGSRNDMNRFCEPYKRGGLYLSKSKRETTGGPSKEAYDIEFSLYGIDGTEGQKLENGWGSGVCSAPVLQIDVTGSHRRNLTFNSGFVGAKIVPETGLVRPEIAWWIVHDKSPEQSKEGTKDSSERD